MAMKETYTDYQPVDYTAQYDLLAKNNALSPHVIDTKRLELDPDDTLPAWHSRPALENIESITFRYQLHRTSNVNARDTLRYGTCRTRTGNCMLWGFETVQEFRDHLARRDKAWAREVWDQTSCELRMESIKYLFWVPKSEEHVTEPGCWAITMDRNDYRTIWIWADHDLKMYNPLKLSKQNRIVIKKEQQ